MRKNIEVPVEWISRLIEIKGVLTKKSSVDKIEWENYMWGFIESVKYLINEKGNEKGKI